MIRMKNYVYRSFYTPDNIVYIIKMQIKIMKPKILCACANGVTRSKYLAKYLKGKGYKAKFGGSAEFAENPVTQEMIDWADIIITLRNKHKDNLLRRFNTADKQIISLEVSQHPEEYIKAPNHIDHKSDEFIKKYVHPEIRKQIKKYLPLEIK